MYTTPGVYDRIVPISVVTTTRGVYCLVRYNPLNNTSIKLTGKCCPFLFDIIIVYEVCIAPCSGNCVGACGQGRGMGGRGQGRVRRRGGVRRAGTARSGPAPAARLVSATSYYYIPQPARTPSPTGDFVCKEKWDFQMLKSSVKKGDIALAYIWWTG